MFEVLPSLTAFALGPLADNHLMGVRWSLCVFLICISVVVRILDIVNMEGFLPVNLTIFDFLIFEFVI